MIYDKPRAELFAQDAPESEIKPFTAWLRGLGIAFEETNGYPEMESFNGLLQALNSYIKYLEQNGFAEWSADLEYPIGAGVRVGNVWYKAKRQNTNKPPSTSQSDWSVFLNAGDLSYADPLQNVDGQIRIKDASTTQKGVVRRATPSEVGNRQNVNAFVAPSDVVSMFSRNSNGITLPNGVILKFGKSGFIGGSNTRHTQLFDGGAFPNGCYAVIVGTITNNTSGAGAQKMAQLISFNKNGFDWYSDLFQDGGGLIACNYIAIGY